MPEMTVTQRRYMELMQLLSGEITDVAGERWIDPGNFRGALPGNPELSYEEFTTQVGTLRQSFPEIFSRFYSSLEVVDMHAIVVSGITTTHHAAPYRTWMGVTMHPAPGTGTFSLRMSIFVQLNQGYQVVGCRVVFDRAELHTAITDMRESAA